MAGRSDYFLTKIHRLDPADRTGTGTLHSNARQLWFPSDSHCGPSVHANIHNMQEIERKFLVKIMPDRLDAFPHAEIHQGYLAYEPGDRQVRVRRIDDEHWLTVKLRDGMARDEVTIVLSASDFAVLWPLTEGRRLHKMRYRVPYEGLTIEIDVYRGHKEGIVVAEVEFEDEERCRDFVPPDWLGVEVTLDPAYKNTTLAFG